MNPPEMPDRTAAQADALAAELEASEAVTDTIYIETAIRERVDELLLSMTVDEKAALTSGIDAWHATGVARIGLRPMLTLDGPNGVRGMTFPVGSTATCTPCGTALGATWDPDLVREVAARIGLEARRSGVDYLLGPVLNLVRSPLGGRDFESFGEDPVLVSTIGAAYVTGIQSARVAATPKHYVANESEMHRTSVDCRVDERTLREVYLPPFEAAARAGAWSMMAAYNRVNGVHCADHKHLVAEILKLEWAWDGVLMSDWHATDDTVAGSVAGLDLEMPGPPHFFGPALAEAVKRGEVSESTLNDQARRVLLLAARVGAIALDGLTVATTGTEIAPLDPTVPWHLSDDDAAALVRRAAAESLTLLANDGLLPLDRGRLRRVAVIGPNAARPTIQGGGAAHIAAPPTVSPLDALRAALPGVEVVHDEGCRIDLFLPPLTALDVRDAEGRPGMTVEVFRGQSLDGAPHATWHIDASELHIFGDVPEGVAEDDYSARVSGWLTPAESGSYEIALRGFGGRRLLVDGNVVADLWHEPPAPDFPTALFEGKENGAHFDLRAGQRVRVEAEYHSDEIAPYLIAVGCRPPRAVDRIEEAAALAATADVAIVVVGTDETWESEGRDRKTAALPGRQDELVEAVAAANQRTIVVVNAGCPVLLPWSGRVAAVLYAFLPGQEFGHALADVLLGDSEPGGRMPFTIPVGEADFPAFDTTPDEQEQLVYAEGVNVGYRHYDVAGLEPRFCFGHGFGYADIHYQSLEVTSEGLAEGDAAQLRVGLHNAGDRPGKEVVQVYVSDPVSSVPRPPRELKGYAAVHLEPGETADVYLVLEDRDLAFWDEGTGGWRIEPGRFELLVGRSERDIRLHAVLELA